MKPPKRTRSTYESEFLSLRRMDCMELMASLPDKAFDLAIVDPPYGINFAKQHTGKGWTVRESKDWDKETPSREYFIELRRVSKDQIVWGGNYMVENICPSMGWIFWDKGQRNFSLADGELAFTSFNRALRVFDCARGSANMEYKIHRTSARFPSGVTEATAGSAGETGAARFSEQQLTDRSIP